MTHHSTFCSSSSTDSLKVSSGRAFSPTWRTATPATAAMKTICRTFSWVNGVMTSVGMIPVRKSSHDPFFLGSPPSAAVRPVPAPGSVSRPMTRPMTTAISDVIMNQSRVRVASRAALETFRRLVIDTKMAKNTSGATTTISSWTKRSPVLASVVCSQPMSPLRAAQPSRAPSTRPSRIWAQKGTLRMRDMRPR